MAYSDFTFSKLSLNFGIKQDNSNLFENSKIKSLEPSPTLIDALSDISFIALNSEKAKSEVLIYPIIRELMRRNRHISVFSGYAFNVKGQKGLTGAPDFLISAKPRSVEPQSPIFCLVETKNKSADEGYAQCAAEMYAARLFNQQTNEPYEIIYGAVTNAYDWVFLKLEGDTVYIDTQRYYLNELPKLLGILQFIVDQIKLVN